MTATKAAENRIPELGISHNEPRDSSGTIFKDDQGRREFLDILMNRVIAVVDGTHLLFDQFKSCL